MHCHKILPADNLALVVLGNLSDLSDKVQDATTSLELAWWDFLDCQPERTEALLVGIMNEKRNTPEQYWKRLPNISFHDFSTLGVGCWVNDEIVNYFIDKWSRQSRSTLGFNTFFAGCCLFEVETSCSRAKSYLTSQDKNRVLRWIKGRQKVLKLETFDAVFLPINESSSHWYSAYIDFRLKRIEIYDSVKETCLINRQKPIPERKNSKLMLVLMWLTEVLGEVRGEPVLLKDNPKTDWVFDPHCKQDAAHSAERQKQHRNLSRLFDRTVEAAKLAQQSGLGLDKPTKTQSTLLKPSRSSSAQSSSLRSSITQSSSIDSKDNIDGDSALETLDYMDVDPALGSLDDMDIDPAFSEAEDLLDQEGELFEIGPEEEETEEEFLQRLMKSSVEELADLDLHKEENLFDFLPNTLDANLDVDPSTKSLPPLHRSLLEDSESTWTWQWNDKAGEVLRRESTVYRRWQRIFSGKDKKVMDDYQPFESRLEWEISQWAVKEKLSQKSFDRLLKIPELKGRLGLTFNNARSMLQKVDAIPEKCGNWFTKQLAFKDRPNETFTLHYRDPIEAIKALWGDPSLTNEFVYKPAKLFRSSTLTEEERIFSEMWTSSFWHSVQGQIPEGGTVAPVIIATDKTQLTQFSGNKSAYPVYMTLGNIPKTTRRKPGTRACILIAYLPVDKAMSIVLDSLKVAGNPKGPGVEMTGGDGAVRRVYP
ncbi:hypothetical protein EV360DRAFT_89847, partial [Lentinula raphanica]